MDASRVAAVLVGAVALVAPVAAADTIDISSGLQPDPMSLSGQTGGPVESEDCGFLPAAPSQVLQVTERVSYMRLRVEAPGDPTLLVEGPDGRFCAITDQMGGDGSPELSGVWLPGEYDIYVGSADGRQTQYELSISQER